MGNQEGIPQNVEKQPKPLTEAQKSRFLKAKTDKAILDEIVTENEALIWHVINEKFRGVGNLSIDDLLQEGHMALSKCVEKFDPERGTAFSSYAITYIEGYLKNALSRNRNIISSPILPVQKDLKREREIKEDSSYDSDLTKELRRDEKWSLPIEVSVDDQISKSDGRKFQDIMQATSTSSPEHIELARAEMQSLNFMLNTVLAELKEENEKKIFFARYGDNLNQPQKPVGWKEIARKLEKVSIEEARFTMERFWRRVGRELKGKIPDTNINENWFYGILKKREKLKEFVV